MASSKLSEKDVVKALHGLSDDETSRLFYHLDLPVHILANIKNNYSGEMLIILCVHEWYKDDLEASWGKIIAGLRYIGMKVLAKKLAIQHNVETPTSVADNPTSDPINPPVATKDSDVTQSPVTSESNPVQPPSSVVSTDHPANDTPNSAPSDPVQPAPTNAAVTNDPFQQVNEEIEQLEDSFASMMSMIRSALCKKESEDSEFIEEFRDYLLSLPLSKRAPHTKFFHRSRDSICNAKTIRELLEFLNDYCNYSNYNLLLRLIKKFGNAAEKKRMQDYCRSLERFEKATPVNIYLVAISARGDILEEFSKIVMKMKKRTSQCTLHDVRKLKEDLCETAFLPSYSVYIKSVDKGCVQVVLCFHPDCVGWILAALTPAFLCAHDVISVSVDGQCLRIEQEDKDKLISTDEDPASHIAEDPSPSTVTDRISGDDHVPDSGPPLQITDQISADEEYARQLQQELYAISDEPDRGGEVKPITERISEEEDAAGQGPSPSTVTDEMSEDVDPAHHVPVSGPPPQTTDQISADEEYARQLQDEEYACQLQSELYATSGVQDRGTALHEDLQPSRTDDGQQLKEETPQDAKDKVAKGIEKARQLLLQLDQGTLDDDVHDNNRKRMETIGGQLVIASMAGDVVRVASLLNSGADVKTNEDNTTPLHFASGYGHLQTVRLLLQRGAKMDSLDEDGSSALHIAAVMGRTDIVVELIKNGANLNQQNDNGYSPLMGAAKLDSTGAVVELVNCGADLNLQNEDGDSAVILATVGQQPGSLKELVSTGADLNLQNQEGLTALMISARSGRTEVTDILLTGENIDPDIQENNTGWSALFFSAERGDVTTTKSLLKAGANAHLKDRSGLTALDITTNSDKGDTEGVCGLLHKYMQKSTTTQSHHDEDVPPSGTGSISGQDSDQDRPSTGDDIDRERDTTSTNRRRLPETLRNLANTSGQTVRRLFDELERRLKSTDEKALFYSGAGGGQQRPQRSKRRGRNRQTASSTREGVHLFMSPPNI